MRRFFQARVIAAALLLLIAGSAVAWSSAEPSLDRAWIEAHAVMPTAEFHGSAVTVRGIRDFRYLDDGSTLVRYYDRTYDLDRLRSAWFVVVPFSTEWRGPAHTFLSFGFEDGSYVGVSVEARREVGEEEYSMLKGLLQRYELMYVIGDERDLIGVRAARQEDQVNLYPVRAEPDKIRDLFVSMLERANELAERPEFYNTLTKNCTVTILDHVNLLRDERIRPGPRILLPGYTDGVALDEGLLDTDLPLGEARRRFRVDDLARQYLHDPRFSARIRSGR